MQTIIKTQSLPFDNVATYITAVLFISGNIVLPQLAHLMPQGGVTWLPIYFFTLVAAYGYGWRVGLLTALVSPLVNSLLFGMPTVGSLPAILLKSVSLAFIAAFVAAHFRKVNLWLLCLVVLAYQCVGTLGEWMLLDDFYRACQDFRIGIPGMLLQIAGGRVVVGVLNRTDNLF